MSFIGIFFRLPCKMCPARKLIKQNRKKKTDKSSVMLPPKIANGSIWLGLPVFCSISIPHLFLGSLLFSICILVLGDILRACLQPSSTEQTEFTLANSSVWNHPCLPTALRTHFKVLMQFLLHLYNVPVWLCIVWVSSSPPLYLLPIAETN